MIEFTYKQVYDWIQAQPDDRLFDMGQSKIKENCRSCLMLQFFIDMKVPEVCHVSYDGNVGYSEGLDFKSLDVVCSIKHKDRGQVRALVHELLDRQCNLRLCINLSLVKKVINDHSMFPMSETN